MSIFIYHHDPRTYNSLCIPRITLSADPYIFHIILMHFVLFFYISHLPHLLYSSFTHPSLFLFHYINLHLYFHLFIPLHTIMKASSPMIHCLYLFLCSSCSLRAGSGIGSLTIINSHTLINSLQLSSPSSIQTLF